MLKSVANSYKSVPEPFTNYTFVRYVKRNTCIFQKKLSFGLNSRIFFESYDPFDLQQQQVLECHFLGSVIRINPTAHPKAQAYYCWYLCGKYLHLSAIVDNSQTRRMVLNGSWFIVD